MYLDEDFHKRVHERHMKALRTKLVQTFALITASAVVFTIIYAIKHGVN